MARANVRGADMSKNNSDSLKSLKKALKQFPKNVQKNIATGAVRAGCKPILTKARSNAPREDGDLKKSIKIRKRRSPKNNRAIVHFSVSAGNNIKTPKGKKRIFYAAFVEWGYTAVNGRAVMARPFMRPAFETEAHKCIDATKAYYAKRIPKEIAKLKKR
jgi:HK97 gp10 family phage protein